jgi:hypothetical protein
MAIGCVDTSMHALKEASAAYKEEPEPQKKLLVFETFINNNLDVTTKEALAELWELIGWIFQVCVDVYHVYIIHMRYIYTFMLIYVHIYKLIHFYHYTQIKIGSARVCSSGGCRSNTTSYR